MDLLKPHTADRVEDKQRQQKAKHDTAAKSRVFNLGDTVYVKNFAGGQRWLPGKIIRVTGPVSFHVQLEDGRNRRCHQDQLRLREVDDTPEQEDDLFERPAVVIDQGDVDRDIDQDVDLGNENADATATPEGIIPTTPVITAPTVKSYPSRHRVPRTHYEPSWN